MAAGLGFKTFTTGEVLTAADTNGYLMQGVNVFADAAARTAAITSPQEGQMSYLKDTNSTEYYSGSAWTAVAGATGGMTLLSTTTLSGTTTTVSGINQTYTNLHIIIVNATAGATYLPRFLPNGTNGLGGVISVGKAGVDGSTAIDASLATVNWAATSANGSTVVINNYASTTQYKTVVAYGGSNASSNCSFSNMGFINTTSAITSFAITTTAGTASFTGGTMLIYGVK